MILTIKLIRIKIEIVIGGPTAWTIHLGTCSWGSTKFIKEEV